MKQSRHFGRLLKQDDVLTGMFSYTEMSRKKLILRSLFGVVVLLLIAGIGLWYGSGFASAAASADQAYRAIEAEGVPLDSEAFAASLRIPAEDDNGPAFREAAKLLVKFAYDAPKDVQAATLDYSSWNLESVQLTLEDRKSAFDAIRPQLDRVAGSLSRKGFSSEPGWDSPVELGSPDRGNHRHSVRLLSLRGQLRAELGDRSGALADLRAAARATTFVGVTPTYFHGLVQVVCVQITVSGVTSAISADPGGAAEYGKVLEYIKIKPFGYFWRGDLYHFVHTSRQLNNRDIIAEIRGMDRNPEDEYLEPQKPYVTKGLGREVLPRASVGYVLKKLYPLLQTINPDGTFKDRQKYFETGNQLRAESELDRSWPGALWRIYAYSLSRDDQPNMLATARLDMGRAIVAVQDFKNRNGRYPKTLYEAGFDSMDMMANPPKPYGLRITENEIRVWSVSVNGTDEGGLDLIYPEKPVPKEKRKSGRIEDGDLVTRMKIR
jgi:hypothetical protein